MALTRGKLVALTAVLIAADQLTKLAARRMLATGGSREPLPFLGLSIHSNRGIAFGLLDDGHGRLIIAVGIVIVAVLAAAMLAAAGRRVAVPLAFLLAGSTGNLVDRLLRGGVTDFLRLPHWPAFNLADIFILAGVFFTALALVFPSDGEQRPRDDGGP